MATRKKTTRPVNMQDRTAHAEDFDGINVTEMEELAELEAVRDIATDLRILAKKAYNQTPYRGGANLIYRAFKEWSDSVVPRAERLAKADNLPTVAEPNPER